MRGFRTTEVDWCAVGKLSKSPFLILLVFHAQFEEQKKRAFPNIYAPQQQ